MPERARSIDPLVQSIIQNREKIDFSKLTFGSACSVLLLGEARDYTLGTKIELLENLSLLQSIGYTHVGLDIFKPENDTSLSWRNDSGRAGQEIDNILDDKTNSFFAFLKAPRLQKKFINIYKDILDESARLGLEVFGVGAPGEEVRAQTMVRKLSEDPDNKVVAFMRDLDIFYRPDDFTTKQHLISDQVTTSSVYLSCLFKSSYYDPHSLEEKYSLPIKQMGLAEERFMGPLLGDQARLDFDWYVNLPPEKLSLPDRIVNIL